MTKPIRDNQPWVIMFDRTKGYVEGNVAVVSWRATRIAEKYTKAEMLKMIRTGSLPKGYTAGEIQRIANFLVN